MASLVRFKRTWIIAFVLVGLWFFLGRLLVEFEWRDLDADSTTVADIRRDILDGRSGPTLKLDPCMMNQTTVNLDIQLGGPLPMGLGRDVVMEVVVLSDSLMVDRLYLGPPIRHLALNALPMCLAIPDLPTSEKDDAAYGYVSIVFVDLAAGRFVNFGGEDAFPIFLWRKVRVDWSVMPWLMSGTESLSNIMVTRQ